MSNFLAIATVTAALQQVLQDPVKNAVAGATVGFNRPSGKSNGNASPVVNIYLYRVTPNSAYRNVDLPTRRSDGSLVNTTLAALDLHYLFTFSGNDGDLEPQRMLGAVAITLESQPLLSTQNISAAAFEYGFLAGSGVDSQLERIKFTPSALTLEEFSKLWSAFFQVEYSLSMAYQASVVLIESVGETPQESLPVKARNVYALPFQQPIVTQVIVQGAPNQPILPTSKLAIQGSQLLAPNTMVRLGNLVVTPPTVTANAIVLPIPTGLQAGVLGVQVIQQLLIGTPPLPHSGIESNVASMVLHPVIVPTSATAAQIVVTVSPVAQQQQRVTLMLNQAGSLPPGAAPAAYNFQLAPLAANTSSLTFPISGVQGATYFIRIAVDGAESPLDLNPGNSTYGPTVTIP